MIRVLVLGLHGVLGGTENYIYNLIRCIDRDRIKCDFLIVGEKRTPYEEEINRIYNDNRNHFYYCPNIKTYMIKGIRWLIEFYKNNKYDLVYLNATSAANSIYCLIPIEMEGTPLITHSHFSNGPWVNHMLFRPYIINRSLFKISCSKPAASWMFGKKRRDVIYVSNGIDVNRFSFNNQNRMRIRHELGISDETILLGHVGRFSKEKNHEFLVNLCKKLSNKYMFLCIGDGPQRKLIEEEINKSELNERFFILPPCMNVEKYYSAMDMFLIPSLYEGFPFVVVEAQCSGMPVVASDSISREIDLSRNCFFESIRNVNDWVGRIESIDYERYDGRTCIIKTGFDMNKTAKKVEDILVKAFECEGKRSGKNQ